jgi:hypothetical protein
MLTENTVAVLAGLALHGRAKRQVCFIPLGGIYWDDEMPDIRELFRIVEEDRHQILRLFGIRVKLWRREDISAEDRKLWESIRSQVPAWAFWNRETITDDDYSAQDNAERDTTDGLAALFADADRVTISDKDGLQSFSATFDLTKKPAATPPRLPFWKRIFRNWR